MKLLTDNQLLLESFSEILIEWRTKKMEMPYTTFASQAEIESHCYDSYEKAIRLPTIKCIDRIAFVYDMDYFQFMDFVKERYYEKKNSLNGNNRMTVSR